MSNPKKVAGLEIRAVGDETLVHDEVRGKVHVLNATAGSVLEWCDGSRSPDEIAAEIARTYGIEFDRANTDLTAILYEFERLELIAA